MTGPDHVRESRQDGVTASEVPQEGRGESEGLERHSGPALIRHGRCGKSWSGATRGHCSGCHETFSSGAFDAHQRIPGGFVVCSTEGLVPHEESWGILWRKPSDGFSWGREPAPDAPSVRDNSCAPGGSVCGTCASPVESEPCREHQPAAYAAMDAEEAA